MTSCEFDPDMIEPLVKMVVGSFSPAPEKKVRKRRPTRVKIDGEYIQTASGKTIWSMPGHAKSALRLHIENCLDHYFHKSDNQKVFGYGATRQYIDVVIDRLKDEGRLEFIEVGDLVG